MEEKILNKRKLNNAGLTLVEILVAVAIFSIAIVPLMYGFVYSAMNNAKAKHLQQTSTLAYTVIENCKAYTLEEIQNMIAAGTFMPDAEVCYDGSVLGDPNKVYFFDNVNMYESDETGATSTQVYDIKMTISPFGAEQDMMEYSNMHKYKDAIFMAESTLSTTSTTARQIEEGLYAWVIGLIKTTVEADTTALPLTEADIEASMLIGGKNEGLTITFTRNIIVSTYADSSGEGVVVTYEYDYNLDDDFKYDAEDTTVLGGIVEKSVNCNGISTSGGMFQVYNSSSTADNLENVYLFYYPPYNNDGIECTAESIHFNNTLGRDINVYLLKQLKTDMTVAEIKNKDRNYDPAITGTSSAGKINLYHNLLTNLGDPESGLVSWQVSSLASSYAIEPMDFDTTSEIEPWVAKDSRQLMYKVLVEVFDKNSCKEISGVRQMTTDSLADMDATFLNW